VGAMSINNLKDNWDANLYDNSHRFVSMYGESLIDLLAPKKDEHILDVGCGTGDLAKTLSEAGCSVIGIDKSANMIEYAKSKYPHIPFYIKDVLELDEFNVFDAVFSNATLHWVKQPKDALQAIWQSLKINGRFVAEFGGAGNVELILNERRRQLERLEIEFQSPWYYPSIGQYASLMEEVGFRVTLAVHYDRPTLLNGEEGLRNWIDMFAASIFESVPYEMKDDVISRIENNLQETMYKDGNWFADYKRIRVIGLKMK
jgi:trans-aconitate methyltransferase